MKVSPICDVLSLFLAHVFLLQCALAYIMRCFSSVFCGLYLYSSFVLCSRWVSHVKRISLICRGRRAITDDQHPKSRYIRALSFAIPMQCQRHAPFLAYVIPVESNIFVYCWHIPDSALSKLCQFVVGKCPENIRKMSPSLFLFAGFWGLPHFLWFLPLAGSYKMHHLVRGFYPRSESLLM